MCRHRTRVLSDDDSGYTSHSSSCSSCHGSPKCDKVFFTPNSGFLTAKLINSSLRARHEDILEDEENIQLEQNGFLLITNKVTGAETLFKPPSRLSFSSAPPEEKTTYSSEEYDRTNAHARDTVSHSRIEYALEREVAKKDLLEVDLALDGSDVIPPRSLGIRIVGINMVRCIEGMLNIYVKRIIADSVAGCDGRIHVDDHIVEVNGVSLVGVSQKIASQALTGIGKNSSPSGGFVHFVLARTPEAKTKEEACENEKSAEEKAARPIMANPTPLKNGWILSDDSAHRVE